MQKYLKVEKRNMNNQYGMFAIRIGGIFVALVLGAIFLIFSGHAPIDVYVTMIDGAFGSAYGVNETIVKTIPLLIAALGVSIAFRMKLWNIGAEGQIYAGGIMASGVALSFGDLPSLLLIPMMMIAAFLGGALWACVPGIARSFWGTNETITTLMMNYVGILWVDYLVFGPWKDPKGYNFPITAEFSPSAFLPTFGGTRVHIGIVIAILCSFVIYILLNKTVWGYEIRVAGENSDVAKYAGMNVTKNIILTLMVSGGIAGIAGMTEVSGVIHRLQSNFSPGYGYSAIIIAWLARLNPIAAIFVSFLFGGLIVGGYAVQTSGLPASVALMLQGLILFCVLGAEFFTGYRVSIDKRFFSKGEAKING
ncbi:ABC transporter permease [Marinisporobacter balticus]|uniref:Nucleoside ABC transporter membrane protein n=1 Tax=Marinisporobacter balticus TaxID=2018667 RepID=A0A4R2KNS7_9FIRM|nr:ABC transporter permease [Marinisporobacter balticus]TCO74372.1 nucleoside ABC transporter membrane protein [Marinisporobacter balticus]